MPLPFILMGAAAAAGLAGIGGGVRGAVKMKEAKDTAELAESQHKKNIKRMENTQEKTTNQMDALGKLELDILHSFKDFQELFEKIKNKPDFKEIVTDNFDLPKYSPEELHKTAIGAGVLLGGLGGAALGTAGGFAAAGATTSAVMALGTASTGTAIASLSGAAATNATLAALGGGAVGSSAVAGGMALGSTVLGVSTLGVGLLVGGLVFNFTGNKLSSQAYEAYHQMKEAEKKINKICRYLNKLKNTAKNYCVALEEVNAIYSDRLEAMRNIIAVNQKDDWNTYSGEEKRTVENVVLLVKLLYDMCKIKIVIKNENEDELNKVNTVETTEEIEKSKKALEQIANS